jgi:hypothetical protein
LSVERGGYAWRASPSSLRPVRRPATRSALRGIYYLDAGLLVLLALALVPGEYPTAALHAAPDHAGAEAERPAAAATPASQPVER